MKTLKTGLLLLLVSLLCKLHQVQAVQVGQTDDFEDGGKQGWFIPNSGINPQNISTGGPNGAGDNFLEYTSKGGSGIASRLVILNRSENWTGNYLDAGVKAVSMYVNNLGNSATDQPLNLRVAFSNGTGRSGTWYASTQSIPLPLSSGWQLVTFPIEAANLTRVSGSGTYQGTMTSVQEMRILSSASPRFQADPIKGVLGVDQITALAAPCEITEIAAGTQTACDSQSNTYSQTIIVTFANPPATGTLDIVADGNPQSFAIGAGPQQSVTLTGLPADGQPVDVTAQFSADTLCSLDKLALYTAPPSCLCEISDISVGTQTACESQTNTYSQTITVTFANPPASGTLDVSADGVPQSFAIGAGPQQSVTLTGLPADGQPVDVTAQFSADTLCSLDKLALYTAPPSCPCEISTITVGQAGSCDPDTNEYTREVEVQYINPPTSGTLDINADGVEQSFPISGSPQTVLLTGLNAGDQSVDVTARFSANTSCFIPINNLFIAGSDCAPTFDLDADNSSGVTGNDYQATFGIGGGFVPLSDGIALTDNGSSLVSAVVTLTNAMSSGLEKLAVDTAAANGLGLTVSFSNLDQQITLSGSAGLDVYRSVLETVRYENRDIATDLTNRTVEFRVNDGLNDSNIAQTIVTLGRGTLIDLVDRITARLPGMGSDGFVAPTSIELTDWSNVVSAMLAGSCDSISLPASLADSYSIGTFTDEGNDVDYCVFMETADDDGNGFVDRGWGTLILRPGSSRQLGIHIPSPGFGNNIEGFGVSVFRDANALYFLMAGTHPEANNISSACQNGFVESDVAHSQDTPYHRSALAANSVFTNISRSAAIEFNEKGVAECQAIEVFMTYGVDAAPTDGDNLSELTKNLLSANSWLIGFPGGVQNCTLTGSANIQGRLLNGVADADVCDTPATTHTGKYIHIELDASRFLSSAWTDAIRSTWPPEEQFELPLAKGWNLISVPLSPDASASSIFAGKSLGRVWEYDATRYLRTQFIEARKGYWVYITLADTITIVGGAGGESSVSLAPGWNLIGIVADPSSPDTTIPFNDVLTEGSYRLPIWHWEKSAFRVANSFRTGKGYWVFRN